jgi:hypothetical protein
MMVSTGLKIITLIVVLVVLGYSVYTSNIAARFARAFKECQMCSGANNTASVSAERAHTILSTVAEAPTSVAEAKEPVEIKSGATVERLATAPVDSAKLAASLGLGGHDVESEGEDLDDTDGEDDAGLDQYEVNSFCGDSASSVDERENPLPDGSDSNVSSDEDSYVQDSDGVDESEATDESSDESSSESGSEATQESSALANELFNLVVVPVVDRLAFSTDIFQETLIQEVLDICAPVKDQEHVTDEVGSQLVKDIKAATDIALASFAETRVFVMTQMRQHVEDGLDLSQADSADATERVRLFVRGVFRRSDRFVFEEPNEEEVADLMARAVAATGYSLKGQKSPVLVSSSQEGGLKSYTMSFEE